MKKILFIFLLLISFLVTPAALASSYFEVNEKFVTKRDVAIKNDLYLVTETFAHNGVVDGDIYVVTKNLKINGEVKEDLNAVAQNVEIKGIIKDDVRIVGEKIKIIAAQVTGDVFLVGKDIYISDNTNIKGDLYIEGTKVNINPSVEGKVVIEAKDIEMGGTYNENVDLIARNVKYNAPKFNKQLSFNSKKIISNNKKNTTSGILTQSKASYWLKKKINDLINWGPLYIFITLLLVFFAKEKITNLFNGLYKKNFINFLAGFVILFLGSLVSLILMIFLIGFPMFFLIILGSIIAHYLAALYMGFIAQKLFLKNKKQVVDYSTAGIGLMISLVIYFMPGISGIVEFILFFVLLAGITLKLFKRPL